MPQALEGTEQSESSYGDKLIFPSIGQGIDPYKMMMNASAMPTTEFVDYSFVFVH